MTTAKHTPGPWVATLQFDKRHRYYPIQAGTAGPNGGALIARVGSDHVSDADAKANAEFIVRACNAHEDLLAALEYARKCIAYCRESHPDVQAGEGIPVELFIDAAIAQARGQS